MKKDRNISWSQLIELVRYLSKYSFVLVVFAVFIFYNVVIVPKELPKKSKSSSSQSVERIRWDITTEKPEKVFTNVLQGRTGDWYRVGVSTMANRAVQIDVSLSSVFDSNVPVGSLDIEASNNSRYHEVLFQVPRGTFSDIRFMLHGENTDDAWSFAGVKVSEFAVSRLEVKNKEEIDRLAPTLAGNIEHITKVLVPDVQISDSSVLFESHFTADADFVQNVNLNVKEKSKENSYVLEIREKGEKNGEIPGASIKKIILSPEELGSIKDEWGNQSVALPARLERGKEYVVSLKGTSNTSLRTIDFLPIEGSVQGVADGKNIVTITFGRYIYVEGGALMSGARIEDFGNEILYSYSLSGEVNDFFDVFNTEGSVKFDTKEDAVVGKQQQRTSFTYRFFTVYPFQKFMLAGRQIGDTEKEVKLEYSFDNAFWREVPSKQEVDAPQLFFLTLSGTGRERVVYVRASYNGGDKKTGTFGLDQLFVHAELIRK